AEIEESWVAEAEIVTILRFEQTRQQSPSQWFTSSTKIGLRSRDMKRKAHKLTIPVFVVAVAAAFTEQASAQTAPLFFREGWNGTQVLGWSPISQESVDNPNLILQLYGPGTQGKDNESTLNVTVRKLGDDASSFIWSGMAEGNWAVTLKHKDS